MNIELAHYTNPEHTIMAAVIDGKHITGITPETQYWAIIHEAANFEIGDYVPDPPPAIADLIAAVAREAERRITDGVDIPGIGKFACDYVSVARVTSLYVGAKRYDELAQAFTYTFRTAAGKVVSIDSFAHADGIFGAVNDHLTSVLARSAQLQESIPLMTDDERRQFEPTDDANWAQPV